jgi:hypothetical protein
MAHLASMKSPGGEQVPAPRACGLAALIFSFFVVAPWQVRNEEFFTLLIGCCKEYFMGL